MLNDIIANRRRQVERNKQRIPAGLLENSPYFNNACASLSAHLLQSNKAGIIAEFKRRSPSKGVINAGANVLETTSGYVKAGASALSVLTETDYFMGSDADLKTARSVNRCPILRKDFIVDEYQVLETKALGADAILLIAACLDKQTIRDLHRLSRQLGLEVLFEIHGEEEIDKIPGGDVVVGVNNRNLRSMEVSLETSFSLAQLLGKGNVLVSESGLSSHLDLLALREAGYRGFLMGETFMRHSKPEEALKQLIHALQHHDQPAH